MGVRGHEELRISSRRFSDTMCVTEHLGASDLWLLGPNQLDWANIAESPKAQDGWVLQPPESFARS